MTKRVDFFYGIGSRYSFLASTRMDALERDTGCTVAWRPLVSGVLMERRGMHPFRQATPPSGQYDWTYRRYDAECWAVYYGIPYKEPDHGVGEYRRFGLACVAAGRLDACAAFSKALFAAVFTEGRDEIEDSALKVIADKAGLDGAALIRMIDEQETAAAHDRNVADALAAGAFGVPTFVCDGRMFWGNDRLVLLRDFLTRDDPEAYPRRSA
jgi:2-hydroxychromene-2-carboxylate isomerase